MQGASLRLYGDAFFVVVFVSTLVGSLASCSFFSAVKNAIFGGLQKRQTVPIILFFPKIRTPKTSNNSNYFIKQQLLTS